MTSSSTTGQTNINLQFELNRNIDAAAQDVQAAIARASGDLPDNMPAPPQYSKVNQTDEPILWLEMSSATMSLDDFAQYANDVFAKRIAMVSGVSQVPVWGPERPAIRVQIDPVRLAAYGLDLEQVRTALSENSASLPSGTLYGDARDYSLQTNSQLTNADQFSDAVVAWRERSASAPESNSGRDQQLKQREESILDQWAAQRDPSGSQAAWREHRGGGRPCEGGDSQPRQLTASRSLARKGWR